MWTRCSCIYDVSACESSKNDSTEYMNLQYLRITEEKVVNNGIFQYDVIRAVTECQQNQNHNDDFN